MILPVILALISLSVADPSGDAFGDGSLTPPTAPIYANAAVFDLQAVSLDATANGTRLGVTLGALGFVVEASDEAAEPAATDEAAEPAATDEALPVEEPASEQPLSGFLPSIVDVYLGEVPGGFDRTLPGPDLLFSQGSGWQYAVRITGDGAYYVAYPTAPVEGVDVSEAPSAADLARVPLQVLSIGSTLVVYLPFTLPDDVAVQAMVGVYDPFSVTGWRPLAELPSPWAFSGAGAQQSPVIDLIAQSADAQRTALQTGILSSTSRAPSVLAVPWLWVMVGGVLVAVVGLVLRGRVRRPQPAGAEAPAAEGADASPEAAVAAGLELSAEVDDDDDDDLIDPRASAADVLAADVVAADNAGAQDQALLVDGNDEFLLDTGEREAAAALLEDEGAEHGLAPDSDGVEGVEPEAALADELVGEIDEPRDSEPLGSELQDSEPQAQEPQPAEPQPGEPQPPEPQRNALRNSDARTRSAEDSFLLDLDDPRAVEDFLGDDDEESFWHPRSRKVELPAELAAEQPAQLHAAAPAQLPAPELAGDDEQSDPAAATTDPDESLGAD